MSKALLLVTIGNISSAASQWYLVWLFAQHDGAAAVGQYSTLIALLTPVFISSQLGLRNLFITLQTHVRWSVYLAVRATTILISVALTTTCLWLVSDNVNIQFAGALLLIKVFESVSDLYSARLLRAERLSLIGMISILSAVANGLSATIIVTNGDSIAVALCGTAVVTCASTCVVVWFSLRTPLPRPRDFADSQKKRSPEQYQHRQLKAEVGTLVRAGIPMSLMQGTYTLLSYVPLGIVGFFGTAEDIGRFSSAAYLVVFANLVGASAETVLLPSYRRIYNGSGQTRVLHQALSRGFVIVICLSPLVLLALFIGPWLLQTVYGQDFVLSRSAVGLFAAAAILTVPTYLMSATLLVLNRYWATTFVGASSIVLAVGSGWISGNMGAGPVEAGATALLCGSIGRLVGEILFARIPQRPRTANAAITSSLSEPDDLHAHSVQASTFAEEQS